MADQLYCMCRTPYDPNQFYLACDNTSCIYNEWLHGSCVNVSPEEAEDIEKYYCPACELNHGPIKRHTKGRPRNVNYTLLSTEVDGVGGALEDRYTRWIHERTAKGLFKEDNFQRRKGSEVTIEFFRTHGWTEPIVFLEKDGLDMNMPDCLTVWDVANEIGEDVSVEAIYVAKQSEQKFSLREWANYYSDSCRKKIYNIISLEISGTKLGKQIKRPGIVRQLDWVDIAWPRKLKNIEYPKAQLYCLMSVKDCYTDFHIDFGGSSVFYHIIHGEKIFYFIRPTPENLQKYEQWSSSPRQSELFLGDQVDECISVHLSAGQTMIIPSGWIHSVYTPQDSMVIGGNFVHSFAIPLQLEIFGIEQRTQVAPKFRYPYFERLLWYACEKYFNIVEAKSETLSTIELTGLVQLGKYLRQRLIYANNPHSNLTTEERRYIKGSVPKDMFLPADILARKLCKRAKTILRLTHGSSPLDMNDGNETDDERLAKIRVSLKIRNPKTVKGLKVAQSMIANLGSVNGDPNVSSKALVSVKTVSGARSNEVTNNIDDSDSHVSVHFRSLVPKMDIGEGMSDDNERLTGNWVRKSKMAADVFTKSMINEVVESVASEADRRDEEFLLQSEDEDSQEEVEESCDDVSGEESLGIRTEARTSEVDESDDDSVELGNGTNWKNSSKETGKRTQNPIENTKSPKVKKWRKQKRKQDHTGQVDGVGWGILPVEKRSKIEEVIWDETESDVGNDT